MIEFYKHKKQQSQFTWKRKATLKEMFMSKTDSLDFQLPQLIKQHSSLQYAPICHFQGSGKKKKRQIDLNYYKTGQTLYIHSFSQAPL